MFEFLMGFDVIGLATLLGALLLLGATIWVLVENRPLEDLNRRHHDSAAAPTHPGESITIPGAASARAESEGGPERPAGGRRVA